MGLDDGIPFHVGDVSTSLVIIVLDEGMPYPESIQGRLILDKVQRSQSTTGAREFESTVKHLPIDFDLRYRQSKMVIFWNQNNLFS
jgi:hypothetical protein